MKNGDRLQNDECLQDHPQIKRLLSDEHYGRNADRDLGIAESFHPMDGSGDEDGNILVARADLERQARGVLKPLRAVADVEEWI